MKKILMTSSRSDKSKSADEKTTSLLACIRLCVVLFTQLELFQTIPMQSVQNEDESFSPSRPRGSDKQFNTRGVHSKNDSSRTPSLETQRRSSNTTLRFIPPGRHEETPFPSRIPPKLRTSPFFPRGRAHARRTRRVLSSSALGSPRAC